MIKIDCAYDALVAIDELIEHPKNPNKHSKEQIKRLSEIITYQGFRSPIVVSKLSGYIVAGHGRLAAARYLKLDTVPVDFQEFKSTEEEYAHIVADNAIALWAELDLMNIKDEIADFSDFDIDMLGLKDSLPDIEVVDPPGDPDEVPAVPVEPKSKLGDVWTLGSHRLMCGDSTDILAVERLMDGNSPNFVYMDPPYGMNLNTNYAVTSCVVGKTYSPVIGDDQDFNPEFFLEYFKSAREHFWWGADYYCKHIPKGGAWVVWDKKKEDLDASIGTGFELCWSREPHKRMLARFLWSGFTAKERSETRVHPTQKPIALHEWFFERWGKDGDKVVDLFGGSGSTLIACEKTKRQCFMMELDPKYIDVILTRWAQYTSKDPVRDDGVTWSTLNK